MNPTFGGPCQGIRNSIPSLNEIGVFTEVVSLDSPDEDFLRKDDILIHAQGPAKNKYSFSLKLNKWLRDNLMRFDVIIIHGLWQYTSYGTFKTWYRLKNIGEYVPALYLMPHGMLDPYFQKAKTRRLKSIRNSIFWYFLESKVVNNIDGLLFTCQQELLLARKTFTNYRPKKEINIGYGIQAPPEYNIEQIKKFIKKCPEAAKSKYLLFLSRVHEKKGVDILIKAYDSLYQENSQLPILIVAGPGMNTNYGKKLKAMSEGLPIYFPGMINGDEKWGAFYGCEAFVLSSHQENFGIVVAEALACSKPVLISDQVNIYKEIENGNAGLIAPDTIEGAITLLKQWLSLTKKNKIELSENARNLYLEKFTPHSFAQKMKEVFTNFK